MRRKTMNRNDMMPPEQEYQEDERRPTRNSPDNVPELRDVMTMAAEAGADARAMVEDGDYEGLLQAAKQSPSSGTDGGIEAIEMFASRLGLGSPHGVDYSVPNDEGEPDYVFGGRAGERSGPPYRPNMRPGGIGSR